MFDRDEDDFTIDSYINGISNPYRLDIPENCYKKTYKEKYYIRLDIHNNESLIYKDLNEMGYLNNRR